MYILLLFLFIFVIIIIFFVLNIIISFISKVVENFRALFGGNKSSSQQSANSTSRGKIFGKNEGEYVDFEEVK